jgi:hypothetical protein
MKKNSFVMAACLIACTMLFQLACTDNKTGENPAQDEKADMSQADKIARGKYLVSVAGCHDCHSPKKMTAQGPEIDSARILSGHQEGSPLPPIDKMALKPGNWVLLAGDLTAAVGPWGLSFSANLTPDSATGIGGWNEETFIKTLRTGKHLGLENGRPILPPMPWDKVALMTDEDLKSIFAYLKAIPAISNKVPQPLAPPDVEKMK